MTAVEIVEGSAVPHAKSIHAAYDPRPFVELRVLADSYAQMQRDRIAISNRMRSEAVPAVLVAELMAGLADSEKKIGVAMRKSFHRACPELKAWIKTPAAIGIGDHLMARLIGRLGHPLYATPHHYEGTGENRVLIADEPYERTVSQLRAYAGVGDPERRRRKGMSADEVAACGLTEAKTLLRLLAESTMKCIGSAGTPKELATPEVESATGEILSKSINGTESIVESACSSLSLNPDTYPDPNGVADEGNSLTDDAETEAKTKVSARRRSPYRDIYDMGRERYDTRDGWSAMRSHNAALRLVSKQILKDVWTVCDEARR